jgi:Ca2+-binding EF-hand superfamily protein
MYHCFKAIDKYSTSRLLSEDIKAYLWQLGLIVTPEEVNLIFRRLDFYNDGVIDEKEFHKYMEIRNL